MHQVTIYLCAQLFWGWCPVRRYSGSIFGKAYFAGEEPAIQSSNQHSSNVEARDREGLKPKLLRPLSLQVMVHSAEAKGLQERDRRAWE